MDQDNLLFPDNFVNNSELPFTDTILILFTLQFGNIKGFYGNRVFFQDKHCLFEVRPVMFLQGRNNFKDLALIFISNVMRPIP